MNRWELLTLLRHHKGIKPIDEYTAKEIEQLVLKTPVDELREGLIEYLLFQMHEEQVRKNKGGKV